jgi:hypothetical protein
MGTAPATELQPIERDILDHFKEGVGVRTIALRASMEYTDVQTIITETCGGDRSRAAALVAAWDRRHPDHSPIVKAPAGAAVLPAAGASAVSEPPRRRVGTGRAASTRRPRGRIEAEAEAPREEPAAPTVVPVNLAELTADAVPTDPESLAPAVDGTELVWDRDDDQHADDDGGQGAAEDAPAPADDEPPAEAPAAAEAEVPRAEDLPLAPAVELPRCTHGGDCTLHPEARGLHDFAVIERAQDEALLDGPTEDLPDVGSFEELMAAAQRSGDAQLDQLAREVSAAVDELHAAYARERHARRLRGEALIIRRELATRLFQLRRLAAGDDPAAIAAAGDQDAGETSHQHPAAA